jgi:hypothetical protein
MNKKLFQMAKAKERERAVEDGFYDGRYRTKVQKDKKKEQKKYQNKRFFDLDEE